MKDILMGFLIGGILGLWFGVNLGKEQPLISNPFAKKPTMHELNQQFNEMQDNVGKKTRQLYEDSKRAVQDSF